MKIESSLLIVKLLSVELDQTSDKNNLFCFVFHNKIKKRTEIVEMPADQKSIWRSLIFPREVEQPIHFQVYNQNGDDAELVGDCALELQNLQHLENQITLIMDLESDGKSRVGKLYVELKGFLGQGEQRPQQFGDQKEVGQLLKGQLNDEQKLQGGQDNKKNRKYGTETEENENLDNSQKVNGLYNKSIKKCGMHMFGTNWNIQVQQQKEVQENRQFENFPQQSIHLQTQQGQLYMYQQQSNSQFQNQQQQIQIQQYNYRQKKNEIEAMKQELSQQKKLQKIMFKKLKLEIKQSKKKMKFEEKMQHLNYKMDNILNKNERYCNKYQNNGMRAFDRWE